MIEKIMKAVKSGNKKRGRNITIGAVVGMLLSCTVAMGADVTATELEITKDTNGNIEFKDESGDSFTPKSKNDPYTDNNWNADTKTYTNNSVISGKNEVADPSSDIYEAALKVTSSEINLVNNGVIKEEVTVTGTTSKKGYGYGIYIASDLDGTLTNNGEIAGNGNYKGYGIYVENLKGNLINNGEIVGTSTENDDGYGIYVGNLAGELINNGTITGAGDKFFGYGIYLKDLTLTGKLTNNGVIIGNGTSASVGKDFGYGIWINSDLTGNLTNNGAITGFGIGTGTSSDFSGYGIWINSDLTGNLTNNGAITGTGKNVGYGIRTGNLAGELTNNGKITGTVTGTTTGRNLSYGIRMGNLAGELTNNGKITVTSTGSVSSNESNNGYGIYAKDLTGNLTNNGAITSTSTGTGSGIGSNNGYGILLTSSTPELTHSNITNTGVIYGSTSAININSGTLEDLYNYGLLVTGGTDVISGTVTKLNNYGLAFKVDDSGNYSASNTTDANGNSDFSNFGTISTEGEYTVVNAKVKNNNANDIGGTESLTLEEGKLTYYNSKETSNKVESISPDKKYVLNGITNTLEVSGENNRLNDSIVNAYETAVVMGDNSMLTLDNTVVNGGMKADPADSDGKIISTVNIECDGSALTVKGDSVINVKDGGVAITVTGNDNAVVLEGNAIVNGKMEAKGNRNILDLDGTGKDGMNMHHDITGFEKMAIDNNVTFFEDIKVTGTNEVTVEGTGVLSLRLKKEVSPKAAASVDDTPPTATHAFSGNGEMTIIGNSPEEAGTLNFITNGIGREILVDMKDISLINMKIKASSIIDNAEIGEGYIRLGAGSDLGGIVNPKVNKYNSLNKIYKSIYSSREENLDGLRDILSLSTYLGKNYDYNNRTDEEQLASLLGYLTSVYIESPYSYSSELSRRSMGMFRDIVTENEFRPNLNNWLIMGGLTHADGGTKDTYYGQNYHEIDGGTAETSADMKLTGAYMLAKYGYSENTSLGLTLGGNKSEAEMSASKVKGNSGYLGAFAENYRGNLTLKAGAGVQYSEYDADRRVIGGDSHSDKYSDIAYDIYLNGRYSNPMGDNFFLEPYATLSYTYIDQDGANEGNKTLAIETDSKSFDYTVGKVGVDLKKVIPHEKGKSTLSAGVSYTKILDGADEEHITGRFKGGSDFDILVAHKNEHSIGLNAKYALELENGVIFDVKGTYSVERDSHNGSAKNKTKGEWIVGAGLGYKF